jgi:CheY-like chemotaxis protein
MQTEGKTVLLIEDTPIAQKVAQLNFEEYGCVLTICDSAKKALLALEKQHFDLIVVDVGLSDMDGYTLTKKIRQFETAREGHFKIIGLSAHIDEQHMRRCRDAGMDAVYSKPLTLAVTREILS